MGNAYTTTVQFAGAAYTVRVTSGARIRTFGGWYQHDTIEIQKGQAFERIGLVQTRRRNKRTETMTALDGGGCVLGTDIAWLVRVHVSTFGPVAA